MELPLRVLVSAIVVGLTVPTILTGLNAYESREMAVRAQQAIEAIVRAAQAFYVAGGGAEDLHIDLSGGVTAKIEYIAIGDREGGPRAPSAVYRVSGQREEFLLSSPPVPMSGGAGAMRVGPGLHVVRVSYDGEGPVRLAVL